MGLKVEAGGYRPCMALLLSMSNGFPISSFHSSFDMPVERPLGSKLGELTIARILPDDGSNAMAAPALSLSALARKLCI